MLAKKQNEGIFSVNLAKKKNNLNIHQGLLTIFVSKLVGEGPWGPVS